MRFSLRSPWDATIAAAAIGFLYGFLTLLPELLSGCFWLSPYGYGDCGIFVVSLNTPVALFMTPIIVPFFLDIVGKWILCLIPVADAILFGGVMALVSWLTGKHSWKRVMVTTAALIVVSIALPFWLTLFLS